MTKKAQNESEHRSVEFMAKNCFQDLIRIRTLENTCPVLDDFLKSDMNVLDIGCGPGTITFDVARRLSNGSVTGVDMNEEALTKAGIAGKDSGLNNVEFRAGDSYSLDFGDNTFDLVYSNELFPWLQDPAKALKEQARVTRSGGWVIAIISTSKLTAFYPECPEFKRLTNAMKLARKPPKGREFFNIDAPYEAVRFFVEAGFKKYQISSYTPLTGIAYPGSPYFEYRYSYLCAVLEKQNEDEIQRTYLANGLIEKDTLDKAKAEIDYWYRHPHALFIRPSVVPCGQVE